MIIITTNHNYKSSLLSNIITDHLHHPTSLLNIIITIQHRYQPSSISFTIYSIIITLITQGRCVHGPEYHQGDGPAAPDIRHELRGPAGPLLAHHCRRERDPGHDRDAPRAGHQDQGCPARRHQVRAPKLIHFCIFTSLCSARRSRQKNTEGTQIHYHYWLRIKCLL